MELVEEEDRVELETAPILKIVGEGVMEAMVEIAIGAKGVMVVTAVMLIDGACSHKYHPKWRQVFGTSAPHHNCTS